MQVYPVFLPLQGCPFRCIYCDQYLITNEECFDLDKHLEKISNFCRKHQNEDKEIAFFGGTFTAFDLTWQQKQFAKLAPLLNANTAIRYSTRPDCLTKEDLKLAKKCGVGTIELGIQDFTDKVLVQSKRGYKQQQAIEACKLVQDFNLKLGIQIMPGLPGFSQESLRETKKLILELKPDYVRIYPTVVLKGTKLADLYHSGKYKPLELEEAIDISVELYEEFTAANIQVIKIGVQIDTADPTAVIAGPHHKAFGELVASKVFIRSLVPQISTDSSEVEIIVSKFDASKFRGHSNYGLKYLQKLLGNRKVKLLIDTNSDKHIVSSISKKEVQK